MPNIKNEDIHTYLNILQNIINRMANNSASCKTWCLTLISALVAIIGLKDIEKDCSTIMYLIVALFGLLDLNYLALERWFRDYYNDLIEKIHNNKITFKDLYKIKLPDKFWIKVKYRIIALKSWSIWFFYPIIGFIIYLINKSS